MKKTVIIMILFCSLFSFVTSESFFANDNDYDITRVEEIVEAGTYDVLLTEESGEAERIIRVTILFPRTVENRTLSEVIDARDLRLEKNTFSTLSNQDLIRLTGARAWNAKTKEKIPVTVKNKQTIDKKSGLHTVTFTTENGTATTINITEVKKSALINGDTEAYDNIHPLKISQRYLFIYSALIIFPLLLLIIMSIISRNRQKEIDKLLYGEE